MKWDVVLAEELDIARIFGVAPILSSPLCRIACRPGLGRGDVGDRRIEPDVEDLALKTASRHRNAPREIARDATVAQLARQPTPRQREDEWRPPISRLKPGPEPFNQLRLA